MDYRDERRRRNSRGQFMSDRRSGERGYGMDERGYGRRDRGYGRIYYNNDERGYGRRDRGYDMMDERRGRDRNYGMDERRGRDRGYEIDERYDDYDSRMDIEYNDAMYLTEHEMRDWTKHLENADGSHGAKFGREQIIAVAKAQGVEFKDFTEDELVMTANMLYSDYCKAIPNSDATTYVRMAKAFLTDPDSRYTGGEKLAKYFDEFAM